MAQRTPEMLQYLAKQRPQKLFHILNRLERFGEGRKVTRVIWKQEDTSINVVPSYWTITRVRPDQSLEKGKIWGVFTWRGHSQDKEKKIRSPLKRQWKLLPKNM